MRPAGKTAFRAVIVIALLAVVGSVPARAIQQPSTFSEEAADLAALVEERISSIVGRVLLTPKVTYLETYGIVLTTEVMLESPRNPFSSPRTTDETKVVIDRRMETLSSALVDLLESDFQGLGLAGAGQRTTLAIHILNSNPVDLPDLPEQIVATALTDASGAVRVTLTEY